VYGSPARMRVEQETARRSSAPVIVTTVLSLLVVAAAVAAVAWLVFRTPSDAVDSAERLEPIGTALPAPTEQPTLPTPIPTKPSAPAAPGFTGEAPEVSGLPTVAALQEVEQLPEESEIAPQDAGPTPTPRVVALPTAAPAPTLPPAQPTPLPAATLPPAVPVEAVPVVALEPVEAAQPAPTAAAERADDEEGRERRSEPGAGDDDPFNIFGDDDGDGSRIVPAQNDAMERVPAIQDDVDGEDDGEERDAFEPIVVPAIVPADGVATDRRDGSMEIVMPDVDAMIDEITAQVTDPNRNPNVGDAGRQDADRDEDQDRDQADRDDDDRDRSAAENRRRSARDRISDRNRRTTTSTRSNDDDAEESQRGSGNNGNQPNQECDTPFENLPEDLRPQGFPFDDC
jgi:hypothetical protein